jgi:hypothetical protein
MFDGENAYYLALRVFYRAFSQINEKISNKCTYIYFQLTHLHVLARKSHLQGVRSQNTNTLITICPKYSHCIQICEARAMYLYS